MSLLRSRLVLQNRAEHILRRNTEIEGVEMPYELPPLPYAENALEPTIDARTMQIHHGKHHQAYVDNLNKAVDGTDLDGLPVEELVQQLDRLPEDRRAAARNNGGGHANHSPFWTL